MALIDAGHVVAIDTPAELAERAAGGQRVRFRPSAPFDPALLTSRPEVRSLTSDGEWMVATGQGDLVNAVILTLAEVGVSAHEVTAESGSLEDAFLALTGRGVHADHIGLAAPKGTSQPDREHGASGAWRPVRRRGGGGPAPPRAAFGRLVASEWRLALRIPVGLAWGLGFPVVGLVIFGILPATNKPDSAYGGLTFFDVYLPVMIAFSLATLSLIALPIPLASYRELDVLRRMATTPVPPSWVLGAQVVINLALVGVAVLVIIVGGTVAFGAHLRLQPLGLVLSLALSAAAMFALGLWVAAIARTQRGAGAIGACLLFPLLFFAGVWLPQEAMPPTLRTISALTPLGAAVHAMDASMLTGHFPPAEPLLALAAWAVVFAWLAVRMFRWE